MSEQAMTMELNVVDAELLHPLDPVEQRTFEEIAEAAEREAFDGIVAEIDNTVDSATEEELRTTVAARRSATGDLIFCYDYAD